MSFVKRRQFRVVLGFQVVILMIMVAMGTGFWLTVCDGSLETCVNPGNPLSSIYFLFLTLLRPFFFTPLMVPAIIAGSTWGALPGAAMASLGATLSSLLLFRVGSLFGGRVRPWLSSHLPDTWQMLRNHDYKIVFITRWIPLFPFDLLSIAFGGMGFRPWRMAVATFFGTLVESWVFSSIGSRGGVAASMTTVAHLMVFACVTAFPLLIYEYLFRKRRSSFWKQIRRTWDELAAEVRLNTRVQARRSFDPAKTPVLLLYGFFSSRRDVTMMTDLLEKKGVEVLTFNLGGLLGVFFTRNIRETARHADRKIKRRMERYGFNKLRIVAYSKGGLVALWWALRLGGHRYCDRIISLGTPYRGSRLALAALFTPLGFFWRGVWQMRPGSRLLRDLEVSEQPESLTLYCCYSDRDSVAPGERGIYLNSNPASRGRIIPVKMTQAHMEFLYSPEVVNRLAGLLQEKVPARRDAVPGTRKPLSHRDRFVLKGLR